MGRMMVCVMFVLLTACQQTPQSSTPPVFGLPRPGVRLVATPDRGGACGANKLRIHFDWSVADTHAAPAHDTYELRVDSPTGAPFASGGREGHADTGDWSHVGQWFFLVDPQTREVIAAQRIGPDGCG